MIEIINRNVNIIETATKENRGIYIYGAGTIGKKAAHFIGLERVAGFIDKKAIELKEVINRKVYLPSDLKEKKILVLVCINNKLGTFENICKVLDNNGIEAKVFNYFDNAAFVHLDNNFEEYKKISIIKKDFFANIVCQPGGWIFDKFADKLVMNLNIMGVKAERNMYFNNKADINHVIAWGDANSLCVEEGHLQTAVSAMVTHVNCRKRIEWTKFQADKGVMEICMSEDTMNMLISAGVRREQLCYVNPAQDCVIKPRKFVLGITHRNYESYDLRKRGRIITDICKGINPNYFSFKIMGHGWEEIVKEIRDIGFEVIYYEDFDYNEYIKLIPSLDYFIYYGTDEGNMGFLDALAAGVKTMVTPQGYHLDFQEGITYKCNTAKDFINALNAVAQEREKIVRLVENATWEEYARKHLEIWYYMTQNEELSILLKNRHCYNDGIFSMLLDTIS